MPTYQLFANTGVQFIKTDVSITTEADVTEWKHCTDIDGEELGWMLEKKVFGRLILAVDTATGPASLKYFAEDENRIDVPAATLKNPEGHLDDLVIEIHSQDHAAGSIKNVSAVIDFGNCRTMGLLVEPSPGVDNKFDACPFQLIDHRTLGSKEGGHTEEVFDSSFEFVRDHLPDIAVKHIVEIPPQVSYSESRNRFKRFLRKKDEISLPPQIDEREEDTGLFPDISPVRLGAEAKEFHLRTQPTDGVSTGMSSPKRYLWDHEPQTQRYWHRVFYYSGDDKKNYELLQGPFFGFLYEDDRDWDKLPGHEGTHKPPTNPVSPSYPRRSAMIMCLYELICQAYQQVNSIEYRSRKNEPLRKRRLDQIVLSFPSGMCEEERDRYRIQAEKALRIFAKVNLREQDRSPRLRMSIDEGTAGQIAYIYGEIRALGTAERWLNICGRETNDKASARIACVDIGGGTSDLMIADYVDRALGSATDLLCQVRELDGMNKGGDEIVLRLIQHIVIPTLANKLGIGKEAIRTVFEQSHNGSINAEKRRWMTSLWIPVCREYLSLAEDEQTDRSFSIMNVCAETKLLKEARDRISEISGINLVSEIGDVTFRYDKSLFTTVVKESLNSVLWHFADVIARNDCDIILLAGRAAKLPTVEKMFKTFLADTSSRIIPLGGYFTGDWYPMQNPSEPGRIADPKSVVCVGAAIEYLCSTDAGLGNFQVEIDRSSKYRPSYYWGVGTVNRRTFRNANALFCPRSADAAPDSIETSVVGSGVILGRRTSSLERIEISPVYHIKIDRDYNAGPISVCLQRRWSETNQDEELILKSVKGQVGVYDEKGEKKLEKAEIGKNVRMELRTLFEDTYFLDMDTISGIDYDRITGD